MGVACDGAGRLQLPPREPPPHHCTSPVSPGLPWNFAARPARPQAAIGRPSTEARNGPSDFRCQPRTHRPRVLVMCAGQSLGLFGYYLGLLVTIITLRVSCETVVDHKINSTDQCC